MMRYKYTRYDIITIYYTPYGADTFLGGMKFHSSFPVCLKLFVFFFVPFFL